MKRLISVLTCIILFFAIAIACMPFWPKELWWISSVVQFFPFLFGFVVLGILSIASFFMRLRKMLFLNLLCAFILLFLIMDFQINEFSTYAQSYLQSNQIIRVLNMNIGRAKEGGRFNARKFCKFVKETSPDIIVLQEKGLEPIFSDIQKALPEHKLYGAHKNSSVVISNMPFEEMPLKEKVNNLHVAKYKIKVDEFDIILLGVHLVTPRGGIQALLDEGITGVPEMQRITGLQSSVSSLASRETADDSNILIAGDFNMTVNHPFYARDWSRFKNSFSEKGKGFGFTKYLNYLRVRIDHILCDSDWQVLKAWVGPSMDSDHRPVIADLKFRGEKVNRVEDFCKGKELRKMRFSDALYSEDFEKEIGSFEAYNTAELNIDSDDACVYGNSMKVSKKEKSNNLKAGISFPQWSFKRYNVVKFAYKFPEETAVCLKVKTRLNDFVTIGGAREDGCSSPKVDKFVLLESDDQWHEVNIDIEEKMGSILSSLKELKEIYFEIDSPDSKNSYFWIDNFIIKKENR